MAAPEADALLRISKIAPQRPLELPQITPTKVGFALLQLRVSIFCCSSTWCFFFFFFWLSYTTATTTKMGIYRFGWRRVYVVYKPRCSFPIHVFFLYFSLFFPHPRFAIFTLPYFRIFAFSINHVFCKSCLRYRILPPHRASIVPPSSGTRSQLIGLAISHVDGGTNRNCYFFLKQVKIRK